jgi:hypothetical protein
VALLAVSQVAAQTPAGSTSSSLPDSSTDQWSLSFNIAGYIVPHDRSYASPTFSADRGWLHLGARYNYEDKETGSLWLGYNFSAGEKLVFEATPMIGGVFGTTAGLAPGYLASLSRKRIELSTEGEYVFDTKDHTGSFLYSWMELAYSPRAGVALACALTRLGHRR